MAYSTNFIGIERVLENVYRSSGYRDIDRESMIEWIGSLMNILGVSPLFVDKTTNGLEANNYFVEISNYRGLIPSDVIDIKSCRKVTLDEDSAVIGYYSMIETQDLFFNTETSNQNFGAIVTDPYFKTVQIGDDGDTEVVEITQENSRLTGNVIYQYKVNGGIMFTNFDVGYVEMSYKGFLLDENGLPMIPNDEKVIRALTWDIIYNLDMINYRLNNSPQNIGLLNRSGQERDWAVGAAMTKGKMPNIDQMESIKNMWLRSIPKVDSHVNGFKTNNYPEVRYTHNARRWRVK